MGPNPQETVDLVIFTEEIFTGKLHFLCSDGRSSQLLDVIVNQRPLGHNSKEYSIRQQCTKHD